jgi:hypothetical protein
MPPTVAEGVVESSIVRAPAAARPIAPFLRIEEIMMDRC